MRNQLGRRFFGKCLCCASGLAVPASIDRRTVLSGLAAVGLGASASIIARASPVLAQTATRVSKPALIDVHHHFIPPFYIVENRDRIAVCAAVKSVLHGLNGNRKRHSTRWTRKV